MAVLLAVSSNALAVCNDSDWPYAYAVHINTTEMSSVEASMEALGFLESEDGRSGRQHFGFGAVWSYCPKNNVPPLAAKYFLAFSIFLRWLNLVPRVMQRNATYGTLLLTCR